MRGLLATAFGSVIVVADEASLIYGAERIRPGVAAVHLPLAADAGSGWLQAIRQRGPDRPLDDAGK